MRARQGPLRKVLLGGRPKWLLVPSGTSEPTLANLREAGGRIDIAPAAKAKRQDVIVQTLVKAGPASVAITT